MLFPAPTMLIAVGDRIKKRWDRPIRLSDFGWFSLIRFD
jgi:hypothetical protein